MSDNKLTYTHTPRACEVTLALFLFRIVTTKIFMHVKNKQKKATIFNIYT